MASRAGSIGILVLALVCVIGPPSAAARQPSAGTAMYVVQRDERLCPSPSCGGYWVAIANGVRTRCQDGARRPRCYVARAVSARGAALASIAEGALVRGSLDLGHDDLGVLTTTTMYAPAGAVPAGGGFYRVVDTGIRCVRAPCFSYRATQVNGSTRTTVSSLDLAASRASAVEIARATAALRTGNGLYARGRFTRTADGGTAFRGLRLYLRAPLTRA